MATGSIDVSEQFQHVLAFFFRMPVEIIRGGRVPFFIAPGCHRKVVGRRFTFQYDLLIQFLFCTNEIGENYGQDVTGTVLRPGVTASFSILSSATGSAF